VVLDEAHDDEQVIEPVAALDIGKAELVCCVRVAGHDGRRRQEVTRYSTITRSLQSLADRCGSFRSRGS
jgi:transposase